MDVALSPWVIIRIPGNMTEDVKVPDSDSHWTSAAQESPALCSC